MDIANSNKRSRGIAKGLEAKPIKPIDIKRYDLNLMCKGYK